MKCKSLWRVFRHDMILLTELFGLRLIDSDAKLQKIFLQQQRLIPWQTFLTCSLAAFKLPQGLLLAFVSGQALLSWMLSNKNTSCPHWENSCSYLLATLYGILGDTIHLWDTSAILIPLIHIWIEWNLFSIFFVKHNSSCMPNQLVL